MVGANVNSDYKIILSLTFDGNEVTEKIYFEKLKELLGSTIGVIYNINPAEYVDGQYFIQKHS